LASTYLQSGCKVSRGGGEELGDRDAIVDRGAGIVGGPVGHG